MADWHRPNNSLQFAPRSLRTPSLQQLGNQHAANDYLAGLRASLARDQYRLEVAGGPWIYNDWPAARDPFEVAWPQIVPAQIVPPDGGFFPRTDRDRLEDLLRAQRFRGNPRDLGLTFVVDDPEIQRLIDRHNNRTPAGVYFPDRRISETQVRDSPIVIRPTRREGLSEDEMSEYHRDAAAIARHCGLDLDDAHDVATKAVLAFDRRLRNESRKVIQDRSSYFNKTVLNHIRRVIQRKQSRDGGSDDEPPALARDVVKYQAASSNAAFPRNTAADRLVFRSQLLEAGRIARNRLVAKKGEDNGKRREAFDLAIRGLSNTEIASAMDISESRVRQLHGDVLNNLGISQEKWKWIRKPASKAKTYKDSNGAAQGRLDQMAEKTP